MESTTICTRKKRCFACGNTTAVSYFSFPSDASIRNNWLQKCNIDPVTCVPASAKLCENHFAADSFVESSSRNTFRKRLKKTAVPLPITENHLATNSLRSQSVANMNNSDFNLQYCFVCGKSTDNVNRSYFRFPKDEVIRKQWLDIIGDKRTSATKRPISDVRICSLHFSPDDIIVYPTSKKCKLKQGCFPRKEEQWTNECVVVDENETSSSKECPSSSKECPTQDVLSIPETVTSEDDDVVISDKSPTLPESKRNDKACQVNPEDFNLPAVTINKVNENLNVNLTPTTHLTDQGTSMMTTPNKYENLVSDHQYAAGPARRAASCQPRYVGGICTPHLETPRRAKRCLAITKTVIDSQKKTIANLSQNLRRLREKVKTMSDLITHLKNRSLLNEEAADNITGIASDALKALIIRGREAKKSKYSAELRKFALALQFYSTRAYMYVRKAFGNILPALSTIRQYNTVVNMEPGISKDVLSCLQALGKQSKKPTVCNLVADEISLKEQTILRGNRRYGFVNMGVSADTAVDELQKANYGLVFLLNALNSNWKIPVAYFLIHSLDAKERANLIRIALRAMHAHDVYCYSMTMDGTRVNISMAEKLGAIMDADALNYRPYFYHPVSGDELFVFIDPSHDLKNARNALATTYNASDQLEEPFTDKEGNIVTWRHIYYLNKIQKEEGVHLANKINDRHIQYWQNKMNVRLAAQTLSNSVADSLTLLRTADDINTRFHFEDSVGTSIFCKNFNDIFDFLNCRTRYTIHTKRQPYCVPLTKENASCMKQWAEEKIDYIKGLHKDGIKLTQFGRKCAFQGFIGCLRNVFHLFDVLQKKHNFEYLLTYKLLQDMIETFFSAVRMMGGFCNNPTPFQFETAMRKLVIHTEVMWATGGNCSDDDVPILRITSTRPQRTDSNDDDDNDEEDEEVESCENIFNFQNVSVPSNLVMYAVRYISGYIVYRMKLIRSATSCPQCFDFAMAPGGTSLLTDIKNRGPMKYASESIVALGTHIESVLQENKSNVLRPNFIKECCKHILTSDILSKYFQDDHFQKYKEHRQILGKFVVKLYLTVRLHHEHKLANIVKKYVRRVNTKLIHFQHQ